MKKKSFSVCQEMLPLFRAVLKTVISSFFSQFRPTLYAKVHSVYLGPKFFGVH